MFHMWNNVKKKLKNNAKDIKDIYYALSRAYNIYKFNSLIKKLDIIDPR